jgi:hypothetical protein
MTISHNPLAPEHLPFFITPPGQTDVLFNVTLAFVVVCIVGLGVIFFTIHTLPERMAHRTKKVQLDFVAILGLIALFTNEHIYWIAALILAFIDLPDFLTPVQRIASAVENLAAPDAAAEVATAEQIAEEGKPSGTGPDRAPAEATPKSSERVESRPKQKGAAHA